MFIKHCAVMVAMTDQLRMGHAPRSTRLLLAILILVCIILLRRSWECGRRSQVALTGPALQNGTHEVHVSDNDQSARHNGKPNCSHLGGLDRIAIILKTGSSEIYEKLPIHFGTTFACQPDHLIYSDVQQDIAHHAVRNALAMVSERFRTNSAEFEHHRDLLKYVAQGGTASHLRGEKSWDLDKWKFLPMVSDAYGEFGDVKDWYVFIEADTYLSLHNLVLWLDQLDASEPIYAGSQVMIGDTEFAHGGSGFVLSAPAAQILRSAYEQDQVYWEERTAEECCGDLMIAEALLDGHLPIGLSGAFPMIQGEMLASLDWSSTHWCRPAVTWHHVDSAGIDQLWRFEQHWIAGSHAVQPILFRDYFEAFVHPRLAAARWRMLGWDNLSGTWAVDKGDDSGSDAHQGEAACEAFCRKKQACLQWSWRPGACRGSKWVHLGWNVHSRPAMGSAEDRLELLEDAAHAMMVSGWLEDRIATFVEWMEPCSRTNEELWALEDFGM